MSLRTCLEEIENHADSQYFLLSILETGLDAALRQGVLTFLNVLIDIRFLLKKKNQKPLILLL